MKSSSPSPIAAVVYDSTTPWVLEMACERNLRAAPFFTQACAVSAVFYHLGEGSLLKYPYGEDDGGGVEVSLPFFPIRLEAGDLPYFAVFDEPKHAVVRHLTCQFRNVGDVDWVLFNTFDSLEREVVEWMKDRWPVKTLGPTFLLPSAVEEVSENERTDHMINLYDQDEDDHYMEWLDSKEGASVVYVSFGSLASLGKEQTGEIAHALVEIGCRFLLVVRKSEVEKLPEDFASLTLGKGVIVNWCRQTRVLAHRAVACFMTHGGRNSTLEALSYGVPMIAMGQWID